MRPGLSKEIVRKRTAYSVGRTLTDFLLTLELVGIICIAVRFWIETASRLTERTDLALLLIVAGVAVGFAVAILQREVLQALFDIADCALASRAEKLSEESLLT